MELKGQSFRVGDFLVEPRLNRVTGESREATLRPQVMDALVYLAERPGEAVTADELMDRVWGDVIVGSGSLYNCINELRRAFDDDPREPRYIETIAKRGYRLTAPVAPVPTSARARHGWKLAWAVAAVLIAVLLWLRPWQPATATAPSIAVMPFTDLSPAGDQGYFADGITEELLNTLAGVEGLRVAARTSSFHFKNREPTIAEVGAALNVAYVLEGSVRRDGDRLRITSQLIEVEDGYHLWSRTFDRDLEDVFAIQHEISLAIVEALLDEMALEAYAPTIAHASQPVDVEAYREYLVGLHLINRRTPEDFESAIPYLERAIERDPDFAPAHANLAITYWLLHYYDRLTAQESYRRARAYAARALELDPQSAQSHAAGYFMEDLQNIHDPGMHYLNRALELNPSYADAINWKAGELESWRRYAEADAELRRALAVDPLSLVVNGHYAINLLRAGRRDEARRVAERLASLDSGWGLRRIGDVDLDRGDYPGAVARYLDGLAHAPRHFALHKELSRLLAELALGAEAARLYASDRVAYYSHLYAGEWESAIDAAEAALAGGGDPVFFTPALAEAHYFARDYARAAELYEQLLPIDFSPGFQPEPMGRFGMIYFSMALRETGDTAGAGVMFRGAEEDVARQREAGYSNGAFHQLRAMTLIYRARVDEGVAALETAYEAGFREDWILAAPLFDSVRGHPRFQSLKGRYQAARQKNVAGVLALICAEDLPEIGWRPMPETCDKGAAL